MTTPRVENRLPVPPNTADSRTAALQPRSTWAHLGLVVQVVLAIALAGGAVAFFLHSGSSPSADDDKRPSRPEEVVTIAGPRTLHVRPGTPLEKKLEVAEVKREWITAPVLPVTGMSLASLRPAKEESLAGGIVGLLGASRRAGPFLAAGLLVAGRTEAKDTWQFATPELLTAFSDWQKAVADIRFNETQLKLVRELDEKRVDAQRKVVARLEKLVAAGTDTPKDLAVEQTNLIQFGIQGRQEVHRAETDLRLARRTEATLARQLQQAGLEPTELRSAAAEGDIVVAEVPERAIGRVKLGMTCDVRFFALPDRTFTGKVSSISPVISKEKRVLNVQFTVKDSENLLRPGMFAEIGLGTDRRPALLMPADGVLHVGDKDYALQGAAPDAWQIKEVQTGELRGVNVEVLTGLEGGDRVVGKGAILLKPAVVRALQPPEGESLGGRRP